MGVSRPPRCGAADHRDSGTKVSDVLRLLADDACELDPPVVSELRSTLRLLLQKLFAPAPRDQVLSLEPAMASIGDSNAMNSTQSTSLTHCAA